MPKVLVLFYSRTGAAARLADAIAEGARGVRFTEVDVRRLEAVSPPAEDGSEGGGPVRRHRALDEAGALADYDAIVLGGPAHEGGPAAELGLLLERAGAMADAGELADRVGAAFAAAEGADGSPEETLRSIVTEMAGLGMIVVPPARGDGASAGSPFGVAAAAGGAPSEAELAAARRHGARVARVAEWVRHAKGHEAGHGHGHHHHHHHGHHDHHHH